MTRKKKPEVIDDPLVPVLEAAVKECLASDAEWTDKVKAIEAGVRLQLAKYKTRETNDKSYFGD